MAGRSGIVDRSGLTLLAYGVLLLAFAVPAWIALGGVVVTYFGDDEEFGHNFLFFLVWGTACLAVALPTSAVFVRLLRRRSAGYRELIGVSALAMVATFLVLYAQGLFNFSSIDYQYVLESTNVRVVAMLFVLGAVVLVSTLADARFRAITSRRAHTRLPWT